MKFIIPAVALFLGAAVFVALLMIIKGGYFATKRRKTKLGLVKLAGAGLKLDDEPEYSGETTPSVAAGDGAPKTGAAGVGTGNKPASVVANAGTSIGAGTNTAKDAPTGGNTKEAGGTVAKDAPATGASPAAVPNEADDLDEYSDSQETQAVPLESVNEESDTAPAVPASLKRSIGGGDIGNDGETKQSAGAAVKRSERRLFGEKLPMLEDGPVVRKIVEVPVENPFINGRLSVQSDSSAKKTTTTQRRRLPETVKMKDRKVILAEDVAINRDLIAMYFDGSGVKFEFAVNGREVCEKFERDPSAYSLILMDIQMPEMDGYEVSKRIRAMDADWAKQIPIIAMTGNDQKEDIDLCFEAGMDDHIPKPIDMEVLQDKVFDILTLNAESF
jgi:CheY-like chemotaxis protein